MFDIYYLGNNDKLREDMPLARQIETTDDISPRTKMYWLVEPSIEITDYAVFEFRPDDYDHKYEHVFKWDSRNYGGLRLIPSKGAQPDVKTVNRIVCKKTFEVLRQKTPGKYFDKHPHATHVWCVDPEYMLTDDIDWAPGNFEPNFIHSFHLKGQLEHKYPEKEGGVKLFPKEHKDADTKYHGFLNNVVDYPVLYVKDVDDYTQRDTFDDDYVWLIDQRHRINKEDTDWVPNPFERDMVHSFRMPYQLMEEYPEEMGGIRLVPKDWKKAETKIHKDCPIEDENYDVFYTNKDFDEVTFEYYAKRADTDWFWVVDRFHDFNGKLLYVPADHEEEYIHVFKWGLEDKYDPDVTDLWDARVAGTYLVHKDFDITKQKLHIECPVRYDVFYVPHDELNNYEPYARKSHTDAFWLVDEEYKVTENFDYVPPLHDQKYINIFKIPGQLSHRYPRDIKNVSDNRCGGAKLVPKLYDTDQAKYQGYLNEVETLRYEIFATEAEGRARTKHPWFWVVDPDVVVLDSFDFDFVPEEWDNGKNHTWQKLNPVTGKQYDYGGVMLCPKEKTHKGRPKFIMTPASTQREYPVYHLSTSRPLMEQLEEFDDKTATNMYWVVDAGVEPADDFEFDYYPTQYDINKVHVFQNEREEYTDIRLVPKNTFEPGMHVYEEKEYRYNSFQDLKEMPTVASKLPTYPVFEFEKYTIAELGRTLASHKKNGTAFIWTVDPDVKPINKVLKQTLNQEQVAEFAGKVVAWQRLDDNDTVLNNGGVRLWSTDFEVQGVTTEQLRTNDIKKIAYIAEPGCTQKNLPVWHLDMDSDIISQLEKISAECKAEMFWAVDPLTVQEPGFDFDYYPTKWDINTVHVFRTNAGTYRNVRLYPTELFKNNHGFTADDVSYNSFPDIKLVDIVASVQESWLVHQFTKWEDVTVENLRSLLSSYKEQGHRFVWSVDPDVQPMGSVMSELYSPEANPQLFKMPIDPSKVHVWQCVDSNDKLINYAGLRLWPTDFDLSETTTEQIVTSDCAQQRYIEDPGSILAQYPVYQLTDSEAVLTQLGDFDVKTEAGMYWVIDPGVEIDEESLSYLPSQWDKSTVHVFETTAKNRYVRLYPKHSFPNEMTVEDIANNSFESVKQLDTIDAKPSLWPVERFTDVTVDELKEILFKHKSSEYVWVIDPDVEERRQLIYSSYAPKLDDANRVHVWQRVSEEDGENLGFGGLRLFPTKFKIPKGFNNEKLRTSEIKDQLILDEVGSTQRVFELCTIDPTRDYIEQVEEFDAQCASSMYWLVDPYVKKLPGWNYKFSPNKWEEKTVHVFRTAQDEYRNVRLVPKGTFATNHGYTIKDVSNNSFPELKQVDTVASTTASFPIIDMETIIDKDEFIKQMTEHRDGGHAFVWTTDTDVDIESDVIENSFMPQLTNAEKVHVWQRMNPHTQKTHSYGGLRLWPTHKDYSEITSDQIFLNKIRGLQYVREPGSTYKPYDIVLLSYHEPYAETAYKRLTARFDNVVWVQDIEGIFTAHQEAARRVGTSMFWVVDADAVVNDDFDFDYIPDVYDQEVVHVWQALNPITGSDYGYGGLKLFNTKQVLDATSWGLDFTTGLSSRFKLMPEVASVTKFNTDEFATWRGAFRECVKLTVNADGESIQRLSSWLNPQKDAEYREAARAGAQAGTVYAKQNINKPVRLAKINDFEWLQEQFNESN